MAEQAPLRSWIELDQVAKGWMFALQAEPDPIDQSDRNPEILATVGQAVDRCGQPVQRKAAAEAEQHKAYERPGAAPK